MKIAFLMTTGIDRPAGQRYMPLAQGLVQRGHQVRILALHPDLRSCPERRFVRNGVEIWYVGQMHSRKFGSQTERFGAAALLGVLIQSLLGMLWALIQTPVDAVHVCKPQPINGMAALFGARLLRGTPIFVDCDDDEVWSNRLTAGWQRAVFGFFQWLLPQLAAGVTVNTHTLANRMRRQGVRHMSYVPNGVDVVSFTRPPDATLNGLRVALGFETRRVIGYAGTLALQNHPVDLLVDAFALLADDLPNCVLLLVGAGEDRALLEAQVAQHGLQDRVIFVGQVGRSTLRALLSLVDVSVDPVYDDIVAWTRSPLKLVESMALGVPVVTSPVGDRGLLLADGAGFLGPAGDAAALANTLRHALADHKRLNQAARAALATAQRYDWHILVDAWAAIYDQKPAQGA